MNYRQEIMTDILQKYRAKPCEIGEGCLGITDPHHILTKGAGGKDIDSNLLGLCRLHHTSWHTMGKTTFVAKYGLEECMYSKGWEFDSFTQKWFYPKFNL